MAFKRIVFSFTVFLLLVQWLAYSVYCVITSKLRDTAATSFFDQELALVIGVLLLMTLLSLVQLTFTTGSVKTCVILPIFLVISVIAIGYPIAAYVVIPEAEKTAHGDTRNAVYGIWAFSSIGFGVMLFVYSVLLLCKRKMG